MEALGEMNDFDYALSYLLSKREQQALSQARLSPSPKPSSSESLDPAETKKDSRKKPENIFTTFPDPPSYNTFNGLIDVSGLTVFFYPKNFTTNPLLKLELPKLLIVGYYHLPMPSIRDGSQPLCPPDTVNAPIFPSEKNDFICSRFEPGFQREVFFLAHASEFITDYQPPFIDSKQITKLQVIVLSFGIYDTSNGIDNSVPLLEFGEGSVEIQWDYSANPQFIMAVSSSSITLLSLAVVSSYGIKCEIATVFFFLQHTG